MNEEIKKFLSFLLVSLILLGLGLAGYYFITQQTQKRLAELEKEARTVGQPATTAEKPKEVVITSQPQVEKKASFYLKTDKTTYKVGDSFNLQVLVNAQGEKIDGVEFVLNFDPKLVSITEVKVGTFFSLYPQKNVDQEAGTIRIIALQAPDSSQVLDEALVVTLPVQALAQGTVSFSFDKEKTHIAGYGGQELLEEVAPLNIIVD